MGNSPRDRALALINQFKPGELPEDVDSYIPFFQEYATDTQGLPNDQQFNASLLWVLAAEKHQHESLLSAYRHIADVFERLSILGYDIWTRSQTLAQIPENLAVSAAKKAILATDLELAIDLLDKCRGLTWSQLLRTLPPEEQMDNLLSSHPELGNCLNGYLRALHRSCMANHAKSRNKEHAEAEVLDDLWFAEEVAKMLVQVRALPGFEEFMLPNPLKKAHKLAESGPIVFLVPDTNCTHIVILCKGSSGILYRAVKGLTLTNTKNMVRRLKGSLGVGGALARGEAGPEDVDPVAQEGEAAQSSGERGGYRSAGLVEEELESILLALWETIGKTIKDMLFLKHNPAIAPKVYLYPSGPLAQLPIHAAGDHTNPEGKALLDYAALSYIPSLQSLNIPKPVDSEMHVVVISQPDTPGRTPLPAVDQEVAVIRQHVPPDQLFVFERAEGDKQSIISQPWMHSRDNPLILHMACHAKQNSLDPLSSAFLLYDEAVPLSKLLGQRNNYPFLAILSACETAAGDEARPDEGLHIGAAMHCLQGFPSVIATLWPMRDVDGPAVANTMYKELFAGGSGKGTGANSAVALRTAVNLMRSQRISLLRWVPFVHFGV